MRRKRRKLLSISVSESDIEHEYVGTASDGTIWKEMAQDSKSGRIQVHNIFREVSGPTGYAKRHVIT